MKDQIKISDGKPVFLSLREKDVVYLAVIFFLLLLVMFNYDFPTDKIPSAFYDLQIYREFKEKYPNSVDEEAVTYGGSYTLQSSYTKGNDTILLDISFNPETYSMFYAVACVTDRYMGSNGGRYHDAFTYLYSDDCIKP